ncbi:hypothetical protein CBR_g37142 [Chara braunii]|uniref:Uncharacterized protein n=1 Tax=Chara braunii TaxID=69332 RepID=A0A388LM78_CHABU|nr:hypothetical protein CBR_g37142 [Chara braunii]|eukprot:GBG83429.1 hypothetical protein CBR_g37142 [Chara braunii]
MRPIGVEATLEAGGSQIRADEMDTGTADMRDQTGMDIGTEDMRGRIEMDTEVADMREEIETGTDETTRADDMTEGDTRESSATIHGGGTTEEIDAMSYAGDMILETAETIHEDDMSQEDLEETATMIRADAPTVALTGMTARADRMATVLLDGMEGVPPDKFYILGSGAVEAIINDGAVLDVVIDNGSEAVIIDEDLAVQVGLGLDRSYLFEIETADGRKQQINGVCHKAAIEVQGVRVSLPVFAVKNCCSDLLLGRTWLSHVHAVTIERPDGSQTLSIEKLDGTRVMIETVDPRDPRNRAALAVRAGPGDQIKSLPIFGRTVRFREKKYGSMLTEEEGRIMEVEDLGSWLIVDGNSYPKETDEEFGGVVSVSFLRARPPMGGYPSDTSE